MLEVVISNTSPLQYLYQLGQLTLLHQFYQQVTVPSAVMQKLAAGAARGVALPVLAEITWLQVRAPSTSQVWRVASTLGAGEREALALALETPNALLLHHGRRGPGRDAHARPQEPETDPRRCPCLARQARGGPAPYESAGRPVGQSLVLRCTRHA
jgi:hypothetical protein